MLGGLYFATDLLQENRMSDFNAFITAIDQALYLATAGVRDNRHKPEDYISFRNKCYSCGKRIKGEVGTILAPEGIGFICNECVYSRM